MFVIEKEESGVLEGPLDETKDGTEKTALVTVVVASVVIKDPN